jgi:ABC-type multidrug transport system ATPase subunit
VTKTFGRRRVLDDVDLVLPSGTFTLLVGPNGSGKTTLLRLFAALTPPSNGRIRWNARDATDLTEPWKVRTAIGFAGHVPLVYDELTVRENLETLLRVRGQDPATARRTSDEWLATLDLLERRDERVDTLSRGLRQRLALAQAFAHEPSILLLDEPGSNLDEAGLETVVKVLRERRGKATILLATHEPDPFRPLADRVLEVRAGKVHDWGAK